MLLQEKGQRLLKTEEFARADREGIIYNAGYTVASGRKGGQS